MLTSETISLTVSKRDILRIAGFSLITIGGILTTYGFIALFVVFNCPSNALCVVLTIWYISFYLGVTLIVVGTLLVIASFLVKTPPKIISEKAETSSTKTGD